MTITVVSSKTYTACECGYKKEFLTPEGNPDLEENCPSCQKPLEWRIGTTYQLEDPHFKHGVIYGED